MGRCSYCGEPAGFLRVQHAECSARYSRAMSMMPTFFAKYLDSQVPAERFSELLRGAAQAAFVPREELASLSVAEIGKTIDVLLAQGAPHLPEIQRISELTDELGHGVAEDSGLNDKLARAVVLAELHEGRVPDAVTVSGPLPFRLARNESVLWIFNRVQSYPQPLRVSDEQGLNALVGQTDTAFGPSQILNGALPAMEPDEKSEGDLVVTNRNLYLLLSEEAHERIPLSRVSAVQPSENGILVAGTPAEKFSRVFLLDDPGFAFQLIDRLGQLAHG